MANKPLEFYIDRYIAGTITRDEWEELRALLDQPEYKQLLEELIDRQLLEAEADTDAFPAVTERVVRSVQSAMDDSPREPVIVFRRNSFLRRWGWAAAALVMVLGLGTYVWLYRPSKPDMPREQAIADITPGSNEAKLTLADGSTITLDSAGNRVMRQGVAAVRQQGGSLHYEAKGDGTTITYNTLSTARGRQFQLVLSDGTKVWLNAASSIRYPTTFTRGERKVEVSGEAYFEVTANARQPFVVSVNTTNIQVLGTAFNVNAYPDEASLCATLVSGLIKVTTDKGSHLLQPGKKAAVLSDGSAVISTADIKAVTAWKNGKFWFENADIQTVMRQLERWYDVQVSYEGAISRELFSGGIERSLPLSKVLSILARNDIRYRIEGRTVIIY
ncbi:FecR family protein [Chitinophaga sp. G-6-1-13]|uniref:FecR family protein n=1 Tax=Chitinophaga fulva TaxID=2728842 RepID=A0A848GWC1_9BACT|nr:FecR family protein [Chitinophaga fulva]NML41010.1 FecR family protein [Chitinophaga fulva]